MKKVFTLTGYSGAEKFTIVVMFALFMTLLTAFAAGVVQYLWNSIVSGKFGGPSLSWVDTIKLLALLFALRFTAFGTKG